MIVDQMQQTNKETTLMSNQSMTLVKVDVLIMLQVTYRQIKMKILIN